jgi:hypothetical protein
MTPLTADALTAGLFQDFATGVTDAPIAARDMGTPIRADGVTVGTLGSLVYANAPAGLSPLKKWGKFSNTGSAAGTIRVNHTRPTTWTYYGRLYIRFSAAPSSNIQFVKWLRLEDGDDLTEILRLQLSSGANQKIEIRKKDGTLLGSSATNLSADTNYRIEWTVGMGPGNDTITVKIFSGDGTTLIETFTNSANAIDTGDRINATWYGSLNNGSLGSCVFNFGAFADALRAAPGPYNGPPANTLEIKDPNTGLVLGGWDHDGNFFLCATTTFQYGSKRQKIYPGDVIFKMDPSGTVLYGLNRNINKPPKEGVSFFEGYHINSGRGHDWSHNIQTVGDPPDLTLQRSETIAPEREGTDGEILASGNFRSNTADFRPIDRGRLIRIGTAPPPPPLVEYWIRDIVDERTVVLEDVNDALVSLPQQTGMTWEMVAYPFPAELSGGKGAVGQIRTKPLGYAFVRDNPGPPDGETNGTAQFSAASGNFTPADVGRHIMIADNPTRVYEIVACDPPDTIQLEKADPVSAMNQAWSIAGGPRDAAVEIQFNPHTLGFSLDSGVLIFDPDQDKVVAKDGHWKLAIANPAIFQGGTNNFATRDLLELFADGRLELYEGDLVLTKAGKGLKLNSPDAATTRRLTVDNGDSPMWGAVGLPFVAAYKTADETVNNSATFQADDHLLFEVVPNAQYYVEAILLARGVSNVPDLKFDYSLPDGASAQIQRLGEAAGVATSSSPGVLGTNIAAGGVNGDYPLIVVAWITVGGKDGNANLRWAQNTATAENSKVLAGSFLRVTRLK